MAKTRTVDVRGIRPGRFRPESIDRSISARPRFSATIGERVLAKQIQRLESQRRE